MPKKSRKHRGLTRSQRRGAALAASAQPIAAPHTSAQADETLTPPIEVTAPYRARSMRPGPPAGSGWRPRTVKHIAAMAIAGVAVSVGVLASVSLVGRPQLPGGSPSPTMVVAVPGPVVLTGPTSAATATPEAEPTPPPLAPIGQPPPTAAPPPAAAPTPTPISVPPPRNSPPVPSVAPSPSPTLAPPAAAAPAPGPGAAVVAVATRPDAVVAAFYRHAAGGDFDGAYALWSDRMKASFPRQGNLDDRFASTRSVAFQELRVAEEVGGSATVQANFTETYDSGSSRQFIGYWRLVSVDGLWLLDEPNY